MGWVVALALCMASPALSLALGIKPSETASVVQQVGPSPAAANPYTYADIPWGTPKVRARALLERRGFTFAKDRPASPDVAAYLSFTGKHAGRPATLMAVLDGDGKLAKVYVKVRPSPGNFTRLYERLRSLLVARFGPPALDQDLLEWPYDAKEKGAREAALRAGKANITAIWPQVGGSAVWMTLDPDLATSIHFEGPAWEAVAKSLNDRTAEGP